MTHRHHRAAPRPGRGVPLVAMAVTLAALLSVSCAAPTAVSDRLQIAREALVHATNAGANDYAPMEMRSARERVDQARLAQASGDSSLTEALSQEAIVDLQLAEAKVRSQKAQQASNELREDRRALDREIQNNPK
jgi:hypothetical protein